MFIHGHAKRIVELLDPTETLDWGGSLDGNTEAEVMGHLRVLVLHVNQLEEYYQSLTVDTHETRSKEVEK